MATNFGDLPMLDAVTVLVSTELLGQLEADWSAPMQIRIDRTPGIGSGHEIICRTHLCPPCLCKVIEVRAECPQHGTNPGDVEQAEDTAGQGQGWCHECGRPEQPDQPLLGLATTHQLIRELAARADVAATIGETWPAYTTVGGDQ